MIAGRVFFCASLVSTLIGAGCYGPRIQDGSFHCGPFGLCPEGYVCDTRRVCVDTNSPPLDLAQPIIPDLATQAGLFGGRLGVLDLTGMTGTLDVSTMTGEVKLHGTATTFVAVGSDGFSRTDQSAGPLVAIWRFARLVIPSTILVRPAADSTDAIPVFAAASDIVVEGSIDWHGAGGVRGLPTMAGSDRNAGVLAGGGAGTADGGGGGAGYGAAGSAGIGPGAGIAGIGYGSAALIPVHMGAGGGGGGNIGGTGGAGGGAVVLLSQSSITVKALIDASGNPGLQGAGGGGGGGGSGGSILLSAPQVSLKAGHELRARGGVGGMGSGTGYAGGAGAMGRIFVAGTLSIEGPQTVDPAATLSPTALGAFPR